MGYAEIICREFKVWPGQALARVLQWLGEERPLTERTKFIKFGTFLMKYLQVSFFFIIPIFEYCTKFGEKV